MSAKFLSDTIIDFDDTKTSALYFDGVIDFTVSQAFEKWHGHAKLAIGRKLAPAALQTNDEFMTNLARLGVLFYICEQMTDPEERAEALQGLKFLTDYDRDPKNFELFIASYFLYFVNSYGLTDAPVQAPAKSVSGREIITEDVALTLLNAKMIDTTNCSWEQILEFRKDEEARQKLRKLRLFAYENYAGKSENFVKEDILQKIEEAEETASRWGFETKVTAMSMLLTSKTLASGAAGSFVSILAGQPLAALLSGAGGAIIEAGRIGLEITRRRYALRNIIKDNPVMYFSYAESKLRSKCSPD